MKLITRFEDEAFKLNETVNVDIATMPDGRIKAQAVAQSGGVHTFFYNDLKTFANDWEDVAEEPKEYWYINCYGEVLHTFYNGNEWYERRRLIGNYFKTEEEAESAVRKLKAWKRLKNKGFKITGWTIDDGLKVSICTNLNSDGIYDDYRKETKKDLDICFGGEE